MNMTREDWQDVDGREAVHAIDDEYQVFEVEVVIASPSEVDVDRLEQVLEHSTAGEAIALGLDLDGTVKLRLPNHEVDGEAVKHAKLLERAAGEVTDQRFAKDLWLAAAELWDRSRSPVASTAAAQCRSDAARIE